MADQGPQRLGAQRDDLRGVVEGECAGDVGGGDLALGVADDGVGGDAAVVATSRRARS